MRLLIVKLSALGDVINSLPVAMAIRAQRPEALVDWLVERPHAGILEGHPALNQVLLSPRHGPSGGLAGRMLEFMRELRVKRYDVVLDLQGLMKSAIFIKFSRGERCIGFRGGKEPLAAWALTERLSAYDQERHALERYLDLLTPLGLERPARPEFGLAPRPEDLARAGLLLEGRGGTRPLVLLHPMAKWESKLWPASHWAELARLLAAAGFDLALTGSGQDQEATMAIAQEAGLGDSLLDLAGRADLKTLAALQGLASAVVSTDTGTMHLAAAVGTPVVALFGPTSARRTGPYGPGHRALSLGLECQPCFRRRCPRPRCLEELPPAQAAQAVLEIMERQPPRGKPPRRRLKRDVSMICVVTGAAGFIGSQVAEALLDQGHQVRGIDCFTDYYARRLKERNLERARGHAAFSFLDCDIMAADLTRLLEGAQVVVHLAAQAGVRRSWGANFQIYTHNNLLTTQALLETIKEMGGGCRLVYASSSSVYGDSQDLPSRETSVCWPVSPYGVTKLAAEHLCTLYNRNFGLDTVSLRYCTVYGPRQRPDMAFHRFIRALLEDAEIRLYGDGGQSRDFTYIDDVVQATLAAARIPEAKGGIFNVGGGARVSVNQVLGMLENILGGKAKVRRLEVAKGDVRDTHADTTRARSILGYDPRFDLAQGLAAEVQWVREMLPVLKEA